MNIDEQLYRLPLIGGHIKRLYSYFKKHTAFTDVIHVLLGLGIGLMFTDAYFNLGIIALTIGILGHVYAFIKA